MKRIIFNRLLQNVNGQVRETVMSKFRGLPKGSDWKYIGKGWGRGWWEELRMGSE